MLWLAIMTTPEDAWKATRPKINLAWLANEIGLTRAAVSAWTKVPAERIIEISRLLGVPKERLRPDLYPADPWSALQAHKET